MSDEFAEERRFADWRLAVKSILGFWLVYAATVIARALLGEDPWTVLHNKVPTIIAGTLLTFVLYAVLNWSTRGVSMYRKAIIAAVLSALAAIMQAVIIIQLEPYFKPSKELKDLVNQPGPNGTPAPEPPAGENPPPSL